MSLKLNEEKLLMFRQEIIVFIDHQNILAAIEQEAKKYYLRLTAIKPPICPPFRFVMKFNYTDVLESSTSIGNLLANEPVLFENIIHDIVYTTLRTVLSQLTNTQELTSALSIQKSQVQIAIRVTSLPYTFRLDGDVPLHNGLGVLRGIIWGHSCLQKYVRSMVWKCPEECDSKIVSCGFRSTAPRCTECASLMMEMAANTDVGDMIIATAIPADAIETPKQTHRRYQAVRILLTDELTDNIEIGQCYLITGLFQYVSQTFLVWNIEPETLQEIQNTANPFEISQSTSIPEEIFDTNYMNESNMEINIDQEFGDDEEELSRESSSVFKSSLFSNILENNANGIGKNIERNNNTKNKRYLFNSNDFDEFDNEFLNLTDNPNMEQILNVSPSYFHNIDRQSSQENSNMTVTSTFEDVDENSYPTSFENPFHLQNGSYNFLDCSSPIVQSQNMFERSPNIENISETNGDFNWEALPQSISQLLQTTRNSPYMFVYSLANNLGSDLMPPFSFMHLKLGLLLSLATIQISEISPLHVLAVGTETLMAQKLMAAAANLAKRFIDPIDKVDGGIVRKDGWVEGGPLLLATGGVCLIGDWSKYTRGKASNSVLSAIESGKIRLEGEGGALDAPSPKYNLNCALWSYWAPPAKAKDQSQLATMLNVFGICFLAAVEDIPDVVAYILNESMGLHQNESVISEDDYRQFLSLISNRKVVIGHDAKRTLREYFVTSRRARSELLPLRALTTLSLLSEAHARLALRNQVIKYDVIMAIWICETSLQQLWGSGIMVPPPVIKISNVTQVDQHIKKFELWLENYVTTVLGDSRFNI